MGLGLQLLDAAEKMLLLVKKINFYLMFCPSLS